MAKAGKQFTQAEIVRRLAERTNLTPAQVRELFRVQASLAYKEAKRTMFVVPGIGTLVVTETAPRDMLMRFGPQAGETVRIPRRKKLKFRVSKAAKDAILGLPPGKDPLPSPTPAPIFPPPTSRPETR